MAYFSICPLCAWIVWLGLGSEDTEDFSLQCIFAPPPSQGSLKGDMGVRGEYFGDGSNCLIRCINRIYGTGLAFTDNVGVVSFIRNLTSGIFIGKSLSFFFHILYAGGGLGFK